MPISIDLTSLIGQPVASTLNAESVSAHLSFASITPSLSLSFCTTGLAASTTLGAISAFASSLTGAGAGFVTTVFFSATFSMTGAAAELVRPNA